MSDAMLAVTLVHLPATGEAFVCELALPAGSCAGDAVRAAGFAAAYPQVDWMAPGNLGVFGRRITSDTPLRAGDRVEIYRALLREPMQARRARAALQAGSRAGKPGAR